MADLAQKKAAFIRRYVIGVQNLLAASDEVSNLNAEWNANAYATGATPSGNNITDMDLAVTAPWITAAQLNEAEGATVAVGDTVATQRGYLEAIRGS
jgi:hypothetical protein